MKTRAAIAVAPNEPLVIDEVDLEGPKAGEVLVEIMATGICHTDAYTLEGKDSARASFRRSSAMKAQAIVREVGRRRHERRARRSRYSALHGRVPPVQNLPLAEKSNLCTSVRATQGQGVMPDGTSRFSWKGQTARSLYGLFDFFELHCAV